MAFDNGVVVALGDEALDEASARDTVLDLDGGIAIPGFRDGHVHPLWGGIEQVTLNVFGLSDIATTLEAVRTWANDHPDEEWIRGAGYNPAMLPGGIGDATVLDQACADRPVVLHSNDHHMIWVNSEALRRAGVDTHTADPDGGTIVRHGDGSPTGTMLEWGAIDLIERHMPPVDRATRLEGLRAGMSSLARAGHRVGAGRRRRRRRFRHVRQRRTGGSPHDAGEPGLASRTAFVATPARVVHRRACHAAQSSPRPLARSPPARSSSSPTV